MAWSSGKPSDLTRRRHTPPGYTSLYPPGVFVVLALFEYWISTLTSSGGTKVRQANFCSVKKAKPVIQHTNNATLSNPQNRCFFTAKYVLCSKRYRRGSNGNAVLSAHAPATWRQLAPDEAHSLLGYQSPWHQTPPRGCLKLLHSYEPQDGNEGSNTK